VAEIAVGDEVIAGTLLIETCGAEPSWPD